MTKRYVRRIRKNIPSIPLQEKIGETETNLPDASPVRPGRRSTRFQNPVFYGISLLSTLALGLFAGYLIWGQGNPAVADKQQFTRYAVEEGGNPSIGPADAPITIIEFSDYQCPYCQKWHSEVFFRLLENYPTQIRIVYRDFPLTGIHPEAVPAAAAANCANVQGAFWSFHNKLFSYEYDLSKDAYLNYAREINLDMTTFTACLESNIFTAEVTSDLNYILDLTSEFGFQQSTPTFFINGIYIVGALPYDSFSNLINKELAGEIP
jgi:protein-disulfide isomerase